MSIAVYVAASLAFARDADACAEALRASGLRVTSSWHNEGPHEDPDDDDCRRAVIRTITSELGQADILVVLSYLGRPRATYVEAGLAMGLGKPIVWVSAGGIGRQIFDSWARSLRLDIGSEQPDAAELHDSVRRALFL